MLPYLQLPKFEKHRRECNVIAKSTALELNFFSILHFYLLLISLFITLLYVFSIIRSKVIAKIPNFLGVFLVDRIVGLFFGISIGLLIIGIVMYILYFFGFPIFEVYPDGKLNKLLLIYLENINLYLEYINVKF